MVARKILFIFALITALSACHAEAQSDVVNTRHNLSVSGPGELKALTETRICIFCHTPHNATPLTPLWNKELKPEVYDLYTSTTLKAGPLSQPTGPTKLCLSCHDGTIALGATVNPSGGITIAGNTFPTGSLSNFGTNLSSHHPVSFVYNNSLPNPELISTPPANLTLGGNGEVHCTTCHDPHNDTYGRFLLMDNRYSALCTSCHKMTGWEGSAHATASDSVVGILPIYPKTWPTYTTLGEWGCETCHAPHFAATPEQLLNFTDAPPTPFSCTTAGCHSSQPPPIHTSTVPQPGIAKAAPPPTKMVDIAGQITKASAHHEIAPFAAGSLKILTKSERASMRSVTCADCHNPHLTNRRPATAPDVSGMLQGVGGVDRNGTDVVNARYEYEVCFKCHGDFSQEIDFVPRVVNTTNLRLAFDPGNASYHPVVAMGKNLNVPSIPSEFEQSMNSSNIIYCTDCHADDEGGSKGPHGSNFPPILKMRYDVADNTVESYENYALCYRCHNRNSILSDNSFRKKAFSTSGTGGGHSGHLRAGIACAACHDPHGINPQGDSRESGSHTHLINFDTRVVQPVPGAKFPVYHESGQFSGTCTLQCHGVVHNNVSYP